MNPKVAIIMGSKSDFPTIEKGIKLLKSFDVDVDVKVASAHRTPEAVEEFVKNTEAEVIIAVAGKAAALPGAVVSFTATKIVIGVPVAEKGGADESAALLSITQLPPGAPVAAMGINAMDNAVLLALRILALKVPELNERLQKYSQNIKEKVYEADAEIQAKLKEI